MLSEIQIYGSRTVRIKKPGGGFDEVTLGFSKLPGNAEEQDIRQALRTGEHVLEEIRESIEIQLGIHPSQRPTAPLAGIFTTEPASGANAYMEGRNNAPPAPPKPKKRVSMSDLHAMGPQMPQEEELALIAAMEEDGVDTTADLNAAVAAAVADLAEQINAQFVTPTRTATDPAAYEPDPEDLPAPIVQQIADMPIPEHVDIQPVFTGVLGIGLAIPDEEDERWSIPLTDINRDETGGGQLKAVNAAITGVGFKQTDRHRVCEAILNGIDRERPKVTIESTRDLSQAQAHVILSWFGAATDPDITRLGGVVRGVAI
jgi:hypothetical protein